MADQDLQDTALSARLMAASPSLEASVRLHAEVNAIEDRSIGRQDGQDACCSIPNPRGRLEVARHRFDEARVRPEQSLV